MKVFHIGTHPGSMSLVSKAVTCKGLLTEGEVFFLVPSEYEAYSYLTYEAYLFVFEDSRSL